MSFSKFLIGGVFAFVALLGIVPLFFRDYEFFRISRDNIAGKAPLNIQILAKSSQPNFYDQGSDILGSYNNISVKRSELSIQDKQNLYNLESKTYKSVENIIAQKYFDSIVRDYMKKNHLSNIATAQKNLFLEQAKVTNTQIKAYIELNANSSQLKGKTFRQQEAIVRPYLQEQAAKAYYKSLINDALADGSLQVVSIGKPQRPHIDLNIANAPAIGVKTSPLTLVVFADFQCPHCVKENAVLTEILDEYKGKIYYVFKNFPLLETHPEALNAAIVAKCAAEQNKYWPVHNALFAKSASLGESTYTLIAKEAGLDLNRFSNCRKRPETQKSILAEIDYAKSLDIDDAPTFYINGVQHVGFLTKSEFEEIINAELNAQY